MNEAARRAGQTRAKHMKERSYRLRAAWNSIHGLSQGASQARKGETCAVTGGGHSWKLPDQLLACEGVCACGERRWFEDTLL